MKIKYLSAVLSCLLFTHNLFALDLRETHAQPTAIEDRLIQTGPTTIGLPAGQWSWAIDKHERAEVEGMPVGGNIGSVLLVSPQALITLQSSLTSTPERMLGAGYWTYDPCKQQGLAYRDASHQTNDKDDCLFVKYIDPAQDHALRTWLAAIAPTSPRPRTVIQISFFKSTWGDLLNIDTFVVPSALGLSEENLSADSTEPPQAILTWAHRYADVLRAVATRESKVGWLPDFAATATSGSSPNAAENLKAYMENKPAMRALLDRQPHPTVMRTY